MEEGRFSHFKGVTIMSGIQRNNHCYKILNALQNSLKIV